jgi:HEPN domain-containing protein
MTKINVKKIVEYWKQGSRLNIKSADEIGNGTRNYVDALFLLHLAIEKAMKALCVLKSKDHAPYTHNLLYLAKCAGIELGVKERALVNQLNNFNLECRYPDEKYQIYKRATKSTFLTLLKESWDLQRWIFDQSK